MHENEISGCVVDAAMRVHTSLGPGLLETVYETVLAHEIRQRGLRLATQVAIPIRYGDFSFDEAFRADLLVEEKVIVELKSVEKLQAVHKKQLLTYLKLSNLRLGLLINFGQELLKSGILRIANNLV